MRKRKLRVMLSALAILVGLIALAGQSKANGKTRFWIGGGSLLNQRAHPYAFGPGYFGHRPYWHSPHYPFRYYPNWSGYAYGYPYLHRYYNRYESSPYSTLEIKPSGELKIMVEPTEAEVWVDGYRLKPQKDFSYRIGLLTGTHQVEVRAEGYKSYFKETEILAGKRTSLSIQLEEGDK